MTIIESFTTGKHPDRPSEDVVVTTDGIAAVVDGATTSATLSSSADDTPGYVAAHAVAHLAEQITPTTSIATAIADMTDAVARLHTAQDTDTFDQRPNASFILYNEWHREVWAVGDCQMLTVNDDGTTRRYTFEKEIDTLLASWRCAVCRSLIARGLATVDTLRINDVGRRLIEPFIARQVRYQNRHDHRLAYGVIDGTTVPSQFVHVIPIATDVRQIVLASDGYPDLLPTLAQSEAKLSQLLESDPLCVFQNISTKGIRPGATSFDDRSYIRVSV